MSVIGNWLRNHRWKTLAGLLVVEIESIPEFARAKILAACIVVRAGADGASQYVFEASIAPQDYAPAINVELAYYFEDCGLQARELARQRNLKINTLPSDGTEAEAPYLYVRACQIWTATYGAGVIPAAASNVHNMWALLAAQQSKCLRALQYIEMPFSEITHLPGVKKSLLKTNSLVQLGGGLVPLPLIRI
jgi:hypothetical protein